MTDFKKFTILPEEEEKPLVKFHPFDLVKKDYLKKEEPVLKARLGEGLTKEQEERAREIALEPSIPLIKVKEDKPGNFLTRFIKGIPETLKELKYKLYGTPEEARKIGVIPIPEKSFKEMTPEERNKVAMGETLEGVDYTYLDLYGMGGGLRNVAKEGLDQIGKAFLRNIKLSRGESWLKKATGWVLTKVGLKRKETPLRSTVWNLMRKRYGEIKSALFDSAAFRQGIKNELSKPEREAIPFIREKTLVPKEFGRPDLEEIVKNPSAKLKRVAEAIGDYYDEGFEFLKRNWDEPGFVENYVNRIWEVPKNKVKGVASYFTTRNPFLKKRTIPTLADGIKLGLKPRTTDIIELLEIYDSYKITTVANKRFVDGLKRLINPETYQKVIQRIDKAPADFKTITHPALQKGLGIPLEEKGVIIAKKLPVGVDPEIAKELEVVFGQPFSSKGARALQTINAFAKKAALSLSFFHHWALSESAISSGIKKKMLKLWNPVNLYRALKKGEYDVLKKLPLAKDAVSHELQLGAISDVQAHRVQQALRTLEYKTRTIPILKGVTKGIRSFNELWDKALWDYFHNGLKLYTYEKWVEESLKKTTTKSVDAVKREVAHLVNDTFGGQVWESLLVTPKAQQVLHWLLLSPDWTLSTIRQAAAPFAGGIRGRLGRKFWARAAFYFWGGSNIINGVMSKKYLGEWRWMWENDPKHKTYIFIGFNEDGSKKYLRFGKQYREIFEWLEDPIKKFGSKLAPTVREAYKQLSGYSVTGWESEWAKKATWSAEAFKERAKSLISMGIPYSISTISRAKNLLGIAMPISKGLTWYEGRELMMDAIERRDKDYLAEIWKALLENKIDAKSVFQSAKSEVKLKKRPEFRETKKLLQKLKEMDKAEGIEKIRQMRESGKLTPEMEDQMRYLLKQEREIERQRMRAGL